MARRTSDVTIDFQSKYFSLRDLTECSDTWSSTNVPNDPNEPQTVQALKTLCESLLDPVTDQFGRVHLTYGFCSPSLQSEIARGISPKHDQHASYERNRRGRLICDRGGAACDFSIPNQDSLIVAKWIVKHVDFDRLYFYGSDRPIHVSVAPASTRDIVLVRSHPRSGNRIPKRISEADFLALKDG